MRFNSKQKIFIILSVVLFVIWICTLALLMQTDYKGNITNAVFTASVGCAAALGLYIMIFSGKYSIKANLNNDNLKSVNTDVLSAYIGVLFVDIAGFFMMSCSSLMIAYDQKKVGKFNLVGLAILITLVLLTVVVMVSCIKISAKIRRYQMQEYNDNLPQQNEIAEGNSQSE